MTFLTLWLTLGLSLLVLFGIDDVVAHIVMDEADACEGAGEPPHGPAYLALCLTLVVVAWPVVLLEYVRTRS